MIIYEMNNILQSIITVIPFFNQLISSITYTVFIIINYIENRHESYVITPNE